MRKNVKGWWCGWYENGKRKAKALPTKTLAEHFRHIKYAQLNSDVFTSLIDFDWRQILEEYKRYKRVEGLEEASIYEVVLTLRHYERLAGPNSSKDITQQSLDTFVLKRSGEIKKNTLNKDIKNLHAFLKWAARNRFVAPDLKVKKVKVAQKPVTSLSPQQVKKLITGQYQVIGERAQNKDEPTLVVSFSTHSRTASITRLRSSSRVPCSLSALSLISSLSSPAPG